MSLVKRSTKWIWPLDIGLLIVAWIVGAAFGVFAFHTHSHSVAVARPLIAHGASVQQVQANFAAAPDIPDGPLAELPGFKCQAWTQSANHPASAWVTIVCVRNPV